VKRAGCALLFAAALLGGCVSQAEQERRQRLVETHTQLGASYLQRGQIDIAKENLQQALEADADDSAANNMMALLQWRLKEYDEAERHFRRAVGAGKDTAEAQNNYGTFLCERGKVDEAVKWFERAAADPFYKTPAIAEENAGLCLMRKPAPAVAEKYFRQALRLEPVLPKSLLQMAHISFDAGNTLSARGFIQRHLQVAPDSAEALWLAVRIERALRNKNEEASYALRLKSKFPDSPEAKRLGAQAGARQSP